MWNNFQEIVASAAGQLYVHVFLQFLYRSSIANNNCYCSVARQLISSLLHLVVNSIISYNTE